MKPDEKPQEYLIRKHWRHVDGPHAWQWQLPPFPGLYTLLDAVSLQEALDRKGTPKAAKVTPPVTPPK